MLSHIAVSFKTEGVRISKLKQTLNIQQMNT